MQKQTCSVVEVPHQFEAVQKVLFLIAFKQQIFFDLNIFLILQTLKFTEIFLFSFSFTPFVMLDYIHFTVLSHKFKESIGVSKLF
jgi:hypothetical protein